MKLEYHVAVSVPFSVIIYGVFTSWPMAVSSLIGGVLVDLDHLADYHYHHGPRLNLKLFFRSCYERRLRKAFVVLHGWEWLLFLALAAVATGWNPWITGLFLGMTQHLLLDQWANRPSKWGYSLLWRAQHGFDYKSAFPD